MKNHQSLFCGLLVFIISASAPAAEEAAESFVARGNEPFWSLEIGAEKIEFKRVGTENIESTELPVSEPAKSDQATVYLTTLAGKPVTIVILQMVSVDSMSGMQFPTKVVVVLPDEILTGVGGNPADLLTGNWSVTNLGETPVVEDAPVTLQFDTEGKVSGNASCNRYSGGFELTGEGLTFEPLVSTRMACDQPRMDQENRFLKLMETVSRFEIGEAGQLTLLANDDPVIVAARVID